MMWVITQHPPWWVELPGNTLAGRLTDWLRSYGETLIFMPDPVSLIMHSHTWRHMCSHAQTLTQTHVYTPRVYEHHTDRHTLTGTQIEWGTHTLPGCDTLPTNICVPDWRGVISTLWTHSAAQREKASSRKHRATSPLTALIEMFYCGKVSSGPAGLYLLKISGDAEHETSQSCCSAWRILR